MGAKIIILLFLVVVIGVGIYVFRSGVVGDALSHLTGSFHFSSSTFILTPSRGPGGYYSNPAAAAPPKPLPSNATPTINPADIPAGFTAAQLSPYFHQVRFGGISAGSFYSYGQITLSANFQQGQKPVDITGWEIKSNRSGEYIPTAINFYDPSGLAVAGDIILQSGQVVSIYSSRGSVNLRLNKCIGYIAAQTHFTPPLPMNCPTPDRSGVSSFSGGCQDFISSIGSCQTPNVASPPFPQNDYACRDYVQHNFSYRACVDAHQNDIDFLSNQWWIWMGSSPFDQYHDNAYLYDKNGLLVDTSSY
jgi:hypothetical protein